MHAQSLRPQPLPAESTPEPGAPSVSVVVLLRARSASLASELGQVAALCRARHAELIVACPAPVFSLRAMDAAVLGGEVISAEPGEDVRSLRSRAVRSARGDIVVIVDGPPGLTDDRWLARVLSPGGSAHVRP